MARASSDTVRLLYHGRTLILAVVGIVGILVSVAIAGGDIGQAQLGALAPPLLGTTLLLLGFLGWLGVIDYRSASSLAIDAGGVSLGGRTIAWKEIRGLTRATGAFRLTLRTDSGVVRFQLLVLPRPIEALKRLVTEAASAGAKVEPYLTRLAEHVEEDAQEPEP